MGTVIGGRYRIDGALSEGGMGVVLRAFHLTLQNPVAIKFLKPSPGGAPDGAVEDGRLFECP